VQTKAAEQLVKGVARTDQLGTVQMIARDASRQSRTVPQGGGLDRRGLAQMNSLKLGAKLDVK
jgi:hypothetical protein